MLSNNVNKENGHLKKTMLLIGIFFLVLIVPVKFYFSGFHKLNASVSYMASALMNINTAFAKDKKAQKDNTSNSGTDKKNKDTGKNTKAEKQPCPKCPDPAKIVFKGLEEKRASIAKAEENLKKEKKSLEKFKGDLDDKLDRLLKLKKQIEADIANLEKKKSAKQQQNKAAFEAKMDRLVKMYAGMKPKNAAKIVDMLDLEVAKKIFSRMRETSAAQILAYVNSEKAAKISALIAYKSK